MLKISLRCNATPRLKLYFVLDLFWCSKMMISEHSAGPSISSSLTRTSFFCCARMCSALWVRIIYVYFFPGRTWEKYLHTSVRPGKKKNTLIRALCTEHTSYASGNHVAARTGYQYVYTLDLSGARTRGHVLYTKHRSHICFLFMTNGRVQIMG